MSYDYSENILVQKSAGTFLWAELQESYDEISISEYRQRIYEYMFTRYKEVA